MYVYTEKKKKKRTVQISGETIETQVDDDKRTTTENVNDVKTLFNRVIYTINVYYMK